jgi:hypothetical protein
MKKLSLSCLAFAGMLVSPLLSQEAKLPAESLSSHYGNVSKHLELGGVFYGYADIDTDIQDITKLIDSLMGSAREKGSSPIPPNLTAAGIVNELGLDSIKAIGASSRKKGDLFHNRAFLATPNGPSGILKLLGGKAAPFLSPSLAPNGADLVVEEDLNLSILLEIVQNIMKQVGDENALAQMDEALAKPMSPLSFTAGEFIKKLNTKMTIVMSMDAEKKLNLKDAPEPVPFIHGFVAADNMGWLFAELVKITKEEGDDFEHQTGDGFEAIRLAKPLPPELEGYKPLLYLEKKTGRIYLGTSPEFVAAAIEGKNPLSTDGEFKKAIDGLPTEGNGLQFISAEALTEGWKLFKAFTAEEDDMEMLLTSKVWEMYFPKAGNSVATTRANLADGMLFTSNTVDSHKSTLITATVYPIAMVAGVAAPMMQRQQMMRAQENLEFEAEEEAPGAPPARPQKESDESPEEKISSNLEQIAFAGEAYFLDKPKEKEVTYAGLIKAGFLFEVTPVAGEDYKALVLKRTGGKIAVKTKSGAAISQDYPAVTD